MIFFNILYCICVMKNTLGRQKRKRYKVSTCKPNFRSKNSYYSNKHHQDNSKPDFINNQHQNNFTEKVQKQSKNISVEQKFNNSTLNSINDVNCSNYFLLFDTNNDISNLISNLQTDLNDIINNFKRNNLPQKITTRKVLIIKNKMDTYEREWKLKNKNLHNIITNKLYKLKIHIRRLVTEQSKQERLIQIVKIVRIILIKIYILRVKFSNTSNDFIYKLKCYVFILKVVRHLKYRIPSDCFIERLRDEIGINTESSYNLDADVNYDFIEKEVFDMWDYFDKYFQPLKRIIAKMKESVIIT